MKGDFISCYLLLQPTLRNVSCEKKLNSVQTTVLSLNLLFFERNKWRWRWRTIKMHESSPVAAALFFIPFLWS